MLTSCYALALFVPTLPEGAYDDGRVLSLFEGAERAQIILGGYALAIAGVAALVFFQLLAQAVGSTVTRAAGTGYGVMLLVASTLFSSIPLGTALDELEPATSPFRELSNAGFHALLVPGLLCAAVAVVSASMALRRTRGAPGWCVVLGFVLAPLLLLGVAWVPQFLVPLWALAIAFATPVRQVENEYV